MSKKAIIFGVILVVSSMAIIIRFGFLQPRPVRMIKPMYVENGQEAGMQVWRRLRHLAKDESVVFFGVQDGSRDQYDMVKGFLNSALAEGKSFKNFTREVRLANSNLLTGTEWPQEFNNVDTKSELTKVTEMTASAASNFFLFPSVFTSHVISENPVQEVEKRTNKKFFTISIVRMVLNSGDLPNLHPKCYPNGILDSDTDSALGCAAKRKSTSLFRKRMDDKRHVIAMEQLGIKDFLIYYYSPNKKYQ